MKEVQDLVHCYIFFSVVKILAISCICFEFVWSCRYTGGQA
jgi:hypothetical protein